MEYERQGDDKSGYRTISDGTRGGGHSVQMPGPRAFMSPYLFFIILLLQRKRNHLIYGTRL